MSAIQGIGKSDPITRWIDVFNYGSTVKNVVLVYKNRGSFAVWRSVPVSRLIGARQIVSLDFRGEKASIGSAYLEYEALGAPQTSKSFVTQRSNAVFRFGAFIILDDNVGFASRESV
jgi:hypothetical protein